jgi:hypothetical protein
MENDVIGVEFVNIVENENDVGEYKNKFVTIRKKFENVLFFAMNGMFL